MNSLKKTLYKYQHIAWNDVVAGKKSTTNPKQEFINDISGIGKHKKAMLWINISMLLVIFAGSIALIIYYINDLDKVKLVFGIMGVSISGMIAYMTYLWRQVVGIELAIAMADKLKPEAMAAIINSLLSIVSKKNKV